MIAHKHFAPLLVTALALGSAGIGLSACKDKSSEEPVEVKQDVKQDDGDKKDAEDDNKDAGDGGAGGKGGNGGAGGQGGSKPAPVAAPRPAQPTQMKPTLAPSYQPPSMTSSQVRKRFPKFKIKVPVPPAK